MIAQDAYENEYDDHGELLPTVNWDARHPEVEPLIFNRSYYQKEIIKYKKLYAHEIIMTLAAFIFGILIGRFLV